jgi:hypothetical protein
MMHQRLIFAMLIGLGWCSQLACSDDNSPAQTNGGTSNSSAGSGSSGTSENTSIGGTGNDSSIPKATGGSVAGGGTTASAGVMRGAFTLVIGQVSSCAIVDTFEVPEVTSGHAVTSSGASQTYPDADCQMLGTVAGEDLTATASLSNGKARLTLGVDKLAVGATTAAGMSLATDRSGQSYGTSNDGPFCDFTTLKATNNSFLAKLTCSRLLGSAEKNEVCGVSESYVTFENCARP